jgi:hypothetical protein
MQGYQTDLDALHPTCQASVRGAWLRQPRTQDPSVAVTMNNYIMLLPVRPMEHAVTVDLQTGELANGLGKPWRLALSERAANVKLNRSIGTFGKYCISATPL